ncbi:hypothetical protein B566_EDAN007151 [Ephemera danica]|nr:hypothetical protein B566_EDAN007151 [Ephemera danica]
MQTMVKVPSTSSLPGLKTPRNRNGLNKSIMRWLNDRRDDDGAEGLWRIHDDLYDFSEFVERHPGGEEWLQLTVGTDITEAFECHHISPMPSKMISQYFVKKAKTPRNSPYTFHSDGFYAKLRRRVFAILNDAGDYGPAFISCLFADVIFVSLFLTAVLAANHQSFVLATVAGLFLGFNTSINHNFFHMKENFRRYYFDMSCMSSTSWRVSHALSHHLFPNTITDLEISMTEPFFYWLPYKDKNIVERYLTWLTSPIMYALVFPIEYVRRLVHFGFQATDLIPLSLPFAMLVAAPLGHVGDTLLMWIYIVMCGSFYMTSTSINGAHHHPKIYHDGDAHRQDLDWGLAQLDSVRDRLVISGVEGSWTRDNNGEPRIIIDSTRSHGLWTLMKVLTNFGHHSLHHMFPTVDHANLPRLYPALEETLTEFKVPFQTMSATELVKGHKPSMAPPSETPRDGASTLPNLKYPEHRNATNKTAFAWLDDKRQDDGAQGLWRVHDTLYDFSDFVDTHPGGSEWLRLTKGTDITAAFEAHHISPMPTKMLQKYAVGPATSPRNTPYTFHPDGFYATLRKRVYALLPNARDRGPSTESKFILDILVFALFVTAAQAASRQSTLLAWFAGVVLGLSTTGAHNFFHLRENFRRYYFDLSMLSSTSWRISHALSHHLFPNTVADLEISFGEPYLFWLPSKDKTLYQRYASWIYTPLVYAFIYHNEYIRRILKHGFKTTDLIPLILPAAMLFFAPPGHVLNTLFLWVQIVMCGSLYMGVVGFNAAHHHPQIFHDGDAPRENLDFGLAQLDTVRDRTFISGVASSWTIKKDGKPHVVIDSSRSRSAWTLFKVLTNFGHHTLHHLFPTVDHATLPLLYPALAETLSEFRMPFGVMSVWELVFGQYEQLARIESNPVPPSFLPDRPHND